MEIKSIEKQGDIVTVKMTMPIKCGLCPFFTDDSEENNYCRLLHIIKDTAICYCAISSGEESYEFCPLRCDNG